MTSTPCSLGWSHANCIPEHEVAITPKLLGGSGGRAVFIVSGSALEAMIKAFIVACFPLLSSVK